MHVFKSEKRSYTENGELTLKGVLEIEFDDYFKMITDEREYAESTKEKYADNYDIILQYIDDNKPAISYSKEDFQAIIGQLSQRKIKGRKIDNVSLNTNYRHLVYNLALMVINHFCIKNRLEDEIFYKIKTKQKSSNHKIIKSLTIKDIFTIIKIVLENIEEEGLYMGILLMLFFGIRNNEAVALKYNDIIKQDSFDGFNIRVNESGTDEAGVTKASTKTPSGNRLVPFVNWCLYIIKRRIEYIRKNTNLSYEEIGELTIVCKGNDFTKSCVSNDISQIALTMFIDKFKFSIEDYAAYYFEMESDDTLEEYTLSAYVFRRNYITLSSLLLNEEQLQLIIGHLSKEANERWEYLQDATYMYKIYENINKPFMPDPTIKFSDEDNSKKISTTSNLDLEFVNTSNKPVRIKIRLRNREFNDPIAIKGANNHDAVIVDEGFDDELPSKDVYVVEEIRRQFKNAGKDCIMDLTTYNETIEFMTKFCYVQNNQKVDEID